MSQNAGLTTVHEDDIAKHLPVAQGMITRMIILQRDAPGAKTSLAGSGRRFVSTVSTGAVRRTREVELTKRVAQVHPDDPMMSIAQHSVLFRARRGLAVALALSDTFAKQSNLETLQPVQVSPVCLRLCRGLFLCRLSSSVDGSGR